MPEITKAYDPGEVEPKCYAAWLEAGAFAGRRDPGREPFCVMIPPPNVTGMLHMGHILNNTLQDIFVRRARLEGKAALWFPGTDHAGIATQTKVEQQLRVEGTDRRDIGREAFVARTWEWREKHGGIILNQLQKLGASCDWERTSFTLDDHYYRAVMTAFVDLYHKGLIYRGQRMVNWCPASLTALSDEEVIMKPQRGVLYKMRYELVEPAAGPDGVERTHLEISTTRPETIMGDTGVAVHPEDERYRHLVGKTVWRPFPREEIPVVADAHVDPEFGTGVLKVTPAHDEADFAIGQRHGLPVRDVFNPDATLNELAGEPFAGMDRDAARKVAARKLEELGLLVEEEPYENKVGFSERAGVPIEPRLSEQWFLKYPRVEEAKRAVLDGHIRFHPKRWEKTYLHWLENIRDWCISRQLWWGHRIPVWYKKGADRRDPANLHVSVDGPPDPENWEQDEDVLDTWASSNLWPFANFGWPEPTEEQQAELDYFYPTSVLVTGFDIIFFWVARMIMAGLEHIGAGDDEGAAGRELTGDEIAAAVPFRDVYITGLIRDEKGRKMAKQLGNSPDPLDLIAEFGADGLRFGIVNIAPSGQDILFARERIKIGRNFCNKLWNACRFRQMSGEGDGDGDGGAAAEGADNRTLEALLARVDPARLDAYDHWVLERLARSQAALEDCFANYEMHPVTHQLHNFFWGDFCDWYVEASKSKLAAGGAERATCLAVQDLVLRQSLLMLHPVIPHITEELWAQLGFAPEGTLIQDARIGTAADLRAALAARGVELDPGAVAQVDGIQGFIVKARALKADYNLASKRDVTLYYTADGAGRAALEANAETVKRLAGAAALEHRADAPEGAPGSVTPVGTVYLDLASAVDVGAEKTRLGKELEKLDKAIAAGAGKLKNDKFVNGAPPHIVEGARTKLAEAEAKREEVGRLLAALE